MEEVDFLIFRKNLVKLRGVRGLSAREVAEHAGLGHPKRCLDIEEGRLKPKLSDVMSICKFFGYKMDEMLYKEASATINFDGD